MKTNLKDKKISLYGTWKLAVGIGFISGLLVFTLLSWMSFLLLAFLSKLGLDSYPNVVKILFFTFETIKWIVAILIAYKISSVLKKKFRVKNYSTKDLPFGQQKIF